MNDKNVTPKDNYHYVMPYNRKQYKNLFSDSINKFSKTNSILDGFCGGMIVDNLNHPNVGRIWYNIDHFFGGNANHHNARNIIPNLPGIYHMIFHDDSEWPNLINNVYGKQINKNHFFEYVMTNPNIEYLKNLENTKLPNGLQLTWIDIDSARIMEKQKTIDDDYCCIPTEYQSIDDFLSRSYGFCIRNEEKVFSRAISYYPGKFQIEIDIETRLETQKRGFASIVSAAFILYNLNVNYITLWNTSSTISAKLATKLGFDIVDAYETLLLAKGTFDPLMVAEFSIPISLKRFRFGNHQEYLYLHENVIE